jgi:hypothetical protein
MDHKEIRGLTMRKKSCFHIVKCMRFLFCTGTVAIHVGGGPASAFHC